LNKKNHFLKTDFHYFYHEIMVEFKAVFKGFIDVFS